MSAITSRPIILLGGNISVAASANLTFTASASGAAFRRIGAAAALSAEYSLVPSTTQGQFSRANLSAGAITAGVGTSFRLAGASLSASAGMSGKGDGTFAMSPVAFPVSLHLEAAGGVEYEASGQPLTASANMLVVNPGVLFDGGAVVWNMNVSVSTTVSPVFRLILPVRQNTFTRHRLFGRYPIDTGVALLIKDGVATLSEAPSDNELKSSDFYFLGGYRHQISPVERAAIVAAGYGDLVEEG